MVLVHEGLYGGGSLQTFYILQALCQKGFRPLVVTNAKGTAMERKIQQAKLELDFRYSSLIQRPINPFKDFLTLLYLIRVMLQEKPDVVLTSGVKLIGLGSLAAWFARMPPCVAVIRGQGAAPGSRLLSVVYAMERFVAWLGTRFITVCEYDRQQMLSRNICPSQQVVTIHNGTHLERFRSGEKGHVRKQFEIPESAVVFGMVGRLYPQKRYDAFVQLMAPLCKEYSHVYGLLVGEGEDRVALQALIDACGAQEKIKITGYVENMPDIYAGIDVSVLFTRYEGLPNALLESCAAGVPMVADDVCGNPEIIRHAQNGYIVPADDTQQALVFCRQMIEDSQLRNTLGKHAARIAEECFDHRRQIHRLIEEALGETLPEASKTPENKGLEEVLPVGESPR